MGREYRDNHQKDARNPGESPLRTGDEDWETLMKINISMKPTFACVVERSVVTEGHARDEKSITSPLASID